MQKIKEATKRRWMVDTINLNFLENEVLKQAEKKIKARRTALKTRRRNMILNVSMNEESSLLLKWIFPYMLITPVKYDNKEISVHEKRPKNEVQG